MHYSTVQHSLCMRINNKQQKNGRKERCGAWPPGLTEERHGVNGVMHVRLSKLTPPFAIIHLHAMSVHSRPFEGRAKGMILHMPVSIAECLYASVRSRRVDGFLVCMELGQDFGNGLLMNEGSPVDRLLAAFIVGRLDILPLDQLDGKNVDFTFMRNEQGDALRLCGTINSCFIHCGQDRVSVCCVLAVRSL